MSEHEFAEKIAANDFVEWCQVHENMYGTSKSQIKRIQSEHKIPLLDIDIQGAAWGCEKLGRNF